MSLTSTASSLLFERPSIQSQPTTPGINVNVWIASLKVGKNSSNSTGGDWKARSVEEETNF